MKSKTHKSHAGITGRAARTAAPWLAVATGITAATAHVHAIEADDVLLFSKGPVSLRPQLAVSETYNDNIFYRDKGRVGDFISTISPGINLVLGRKGENPPDYGRSMERGNYLEFDYQYDHFFYADQSQLDTDQHLLDLTDHLDWSRVHLQGGDSVHFLSGIIGGGERSSIGDQNVDNTTFLDDYTVRVDVTEKTSAYVRGHYDATDYQNGIPLYDINDLIGTLGFGFQAFPRLDFFGEGYYGQTAVSPNSPALPDSPHSDFFGGFVGANGKFTEKLVGSAKVGYEIREFSDGTPAPSAPAVDISLTERFTDRTSLSASYSRRTGVSVQFAKEPYTSDAITVQFGQVLGATGKLIATVGGSYYLNNYTQTDFLAKRADSDFRGFATLTYKIQSWLRASLGYDYEKFSSDAAGVIDYDVNRVTLRLAIGY